MIKIIVLLIALALSIFLGIYLYPSINNIPLDILASFGIFIGTILAIVILFFILLFLCTFFEKKDFKREYPSLYFRKFLLLMDKLLFSLFNVKFIAHGKENLSISQQYIFISNHRSNLDSLLIDKYLSSFPLTFITKDSLFKVPFVGHIIHGCAYIKLDRKDINQEFLAYKQALKMLTRSDSPLSIGLFPEGTRNKDGKMDELLDFKAGSFRLAKNSRKPIVLIAIRGSKEVNNHLLLKRHRVYLDIIEVISPEEYKDKDVQEIANYCKNKIETFIKEANK